METRELVRHAKMAMENAYAPYSHFRVGAALLTDNETVFTGCNVENASFGGSNCAERTALYKAISEGERKFKAIAIISDNTDYTYPCGICRQVLVEFGLDLDIIVAKNNEEYKIHKLVELLPFAFTNFELERRDADE